MSQRETRKEGDVTWKIVRYDNGNIGWQIPYVNDKQHGLVTWFYKDGSLISLFKCKNNELKLWIKFPKDNKAIKPQTIKLNLRKQRTYVRR